MAKLNIATVLGISFLGLAYVHSASLQQERPSLEVPQTTEQFPDATAWESAATIKTLGAPLNKELQEGTQSTGVGVLWNADFLFVRFQCEDARITPLAEHTSGRDAPYHRADCVEVFLDPMGDAKAFLEIQVGPDNGVFDAMHLCTGKPESQDDFLLTQETLQREMWFTSEWDLDGLETRTTKEDRGWSAVIAIPAKAVLRRLGKSHFEPGMILRANFVRLDYAAPGSEAVITNWAPVVEGRVHRSPAGMGFLRLK